MKILRFQALFAMSLLAVAGCGLSEYQSRMDAQRRRVTEFDIANRSLDEPIIIPYIQLQGAKKEPAKDAKDVKDENKEGIAAWPFDFYLRLPKGYGPTPKDKTPYYSPFPCFRYNASEPETDIFVAAAHIADAKAKDKEEFGKYFPDNFRIFVRLAIKDFYRQHTKGELKLPDKDQYEVIEVKALSPYSDVNTKIPYKYLSYSDANNANVKDPTSFRVYLFEDYGSPKEEGKERTQGKQVAVVARRPLRAQNDSFDKAIEASLGTLDVTLDSGNKRTNYRKAMKR
ncbi:MAG TPA: hypothetical protein VFE62_29790 [Gemmataceae bacterium]|nr:hypothetical protein [Gemmataceae bacterium]